MTTTEDTVPRGMILDKEVVRVIAVLRQIWAEEFPITSNTQWDLTYYSVFAKMAVAMINDRESPAAVRFALVMEHP